MRRIWWAYPLYLLSAAPLLSRVFDWAYRTFAINRHRFSRAHAGCRARQASRRKGSAAEHDSRSGHPERSRPGRAAEFEQAFHQAQRIISSMAGYVSRASALPEVENKYVLLVRWRRPEDHTEGFSQVSGNIDEWRRLLHHFYDPFPRWSITNPAIRN